MVNFHPFLTTVFLYKCLVINSVQTNKNAINDYKELDSEQDLKHFDLCAKTVALLIEDNQQNFNNVLDLLQAVFKNDSFQNSDFWLVTFNSSGVSSVWEKSYSNIEKFYSTLEALALHSSSEFQDNNNNSLTLFSLLNTAQILPQNAAIIIFTDSKHILDNHLKEMTLNKILSKNITLYIVNNGNKENEILTKIIDISGGKSLKLNRNKFDQYKLDPFIMPQEDVSVILTRKNLVNTNNLTFPIDQDVTGLHIVVSSSKTTGGFLVSPTGYQFSFSKDTKSSKIKYSQGSYFENQNEYFELHLNFSRSGRSNIGIWHLNLENSRYFYNVTVFVFTGISANALIHYTEKGQNENELFKDVMTLGVTGKISHITDISVLDSNGEPLLSNKSYKFNNNNRLKYVTENIDNLPDTENKDVNIEFSRLRNTQPVYALVRGKDVKGNVFQRLGYILDSVHKDMYPQQFLTVEVGLGSELIVPSGKRAEVYFEVTNHANTAQLVTYSCSDHKYILQSLSIYKKYLEPKESSIAVLYLNTKYGTYKDEITFTAHSGSLSVQKKVLVDVGAQIRDQNWPELYHTYTSDCTGVIFSDCSKGTWTIEITARDTESGLLQVNTMPKGLHFPHGYTSGTKDSVTAYFSDTCCNPKLHISAVDRLNNIHHYEVNAYHNVWSPGAIAALVLGILLFIILVAVITFFAVRKWKQKESYDLPTYRGGGI